MIYMNCARRWRPATAALALVYLLIGCSGPQTMSGTKAKEGAGTGAAIGAVGGVLVSLATGDRSFGDAAIAGAAVGAAAGAAAGAASGSAQDAEVKQKIGQTNYDGLMYLVNCQHGFALDKAEQEQKSDNPEYARAALWLEVLTTADMGDQERLTDLYDILAAEDPAVDSAATAANKTKRALLKVGDYRVEMNKSRRCN